MNNQETCIMKERPVSERPYEKCLSKGPQALTDAELLAVILRTGVRGSTSLELAYRILSLTNTSGSALAGIHHLSGNQLMKIKGIGKVKAIQILAIAELSKRITSARARESLVFHQPETIAAYYMEQLRHKEQEVLICMMLDTKNQLLGERELFRGTVNASIISPREVFLDALRQQAVNIILIHNHPSGDPSPSREDVLITERIRQAGELLEIHLLDHIVIGDHQYVSFREKEML